MTTKEKPAEFVTAEQMEAHVAALEAEADFCVATAKGPNLSDEQRAARARRAKEAKAEITRIRKENRVPAKDTVADEPEAAES